MKNPLPSTTEKLADLKIGEPQAFGELARRPDFGTAGEEITLLANYFQLTVANDLQLHKYSIKFHSEIKGARKRRRLVHLLLDDGFFSPYRSTIATDYAALLISDQILDFGNSASREFEVSYYSEFERSSGARCNSYTVTVEYNRSLAIQGLLKYLRSSSQETEFPQKEEVINGLNAIITRLPNTKPDVMSTSRNSRFFPLRSENTRQVGHCLEAVRGYYTSVRTTRDRLLVNTNSCASAFYPAWPLQNLIPQVERERLDLQTFLYGVQVIAEYLKDDKGKIRPVMRTIIGVGSSVRDTKFPCQRLDAKTNISVEEYFKKQHQITLDPKGRVVEVRKAAQKAPSSHGRQEAASAKEEANMRVWLPAEVCRVHRGQVYRKGMPPHLTTAMIGFAVKDPQEKARHILGEGSQLLGFNGDQAQLRSFGMSVRTEMIEVKGRRLNIPQIIYQGPSVKRTPKDGSWDFQNVKFANIEKPDLKWTHLVIDNVTVSEAGLQRLNNTLSNYGFRPSRDPRQGYVARDRKQVEERIAQARKGSVDILLVILDKKDASLYSFIKGRGDVIHGVQTVCTIIDKFKISKGDYLANLAVKHPNLVTSVVILTLYQLKFNLKTGGTNHKISQDDLGLLKEGTMVVGYDVTHPGPGAQKDTPSVAGLVASVDAQYNQWIPSVRFQDEPGQEMVVRPLEAMFLRSLHSWKSRNNNVLPGRILIYRDGVSEGQYDQVLETELPKIEGACDKLYSTQHKKPQITLVVVGKRHHTRFFAKGEAGKVAGKTPVGLVGINFLFPIADD